MEINIRPATVRDATDLAAFVDMAGEGLPTHLWRGMAEPGQSPFEVGRARAMRDQGSFSWRNAVLAEVEGAIAGALVGYRIPDAVDLSELASLPDLVRPLAELETQAPGYWYVNVLAVYPEFRGRGVGKALLRHADGIGTSVGTVGMAIIVASHNEPAMTLYEKSGYRVVARRAAVAYPGGRKGGDWVLLTRSHS